VPQPDGGPPTLDGTTPKPDAATPKPDAATPKPDAATPTTALSFTAIPTTNADLIAPGRRGEGIASALLASAIDYARAHGARVLEAYPIDRDRPVSNGDAYTGVPSLYTKAGFREVGRFDRWAAVPDVAGPSPKRLVRPPGRPVMRLEFTR
jgi:hypothetical protein